MMHVRKSIKKEHDNVVMLNVRPFIMQGNTLSCGGHVNRTALCLQVLKFCILKLMFVAYKNVLDKSD
jgi:hypothetical protein